MLSKKFIRLCENLNPLVFHLLLVTMIAMEQHAVPQDIAGFKFKLVGDMTLKQFGELAGGAVLAYLFYSSGWPFFIRWPLIIGAGSFGFALAFLPIEERPLDVWIVNFLKAIYQPTLYVWRKKPAALAYIPTTPSAPARPQPSDIPPPTKVAFVQPGPAPIPQIPPSPTTAEPGVLPPLPTPQPSTPPASTPTTPPTLSVEELQKLREEKLKELGWAKKQLDQMTTQVRTDTYQAQKGGDIMTLDRLAQVRDEKQQDLDHQFKDLLSEDRKIIDQIETIKARILSLQGMDTAQLQSQLQTLSQQREALAAKIASFQAQIQKAPPPPPPTAAPSDSQVRVVDRPAVKETMISLTDVPNIINGLIVNEGGMPLDNTILVIKDKTGNSVRALKSNQVGQFIASTPLENGTYYLEFERPNYHFDVLEVVMNGQPLAPIQVCGKATNLNASS